MGKRSFELKAGLNNVRNELERARLGALMNSLDEAAGTYAEEKEKCAVMALNAVMDFLRDERLEAPFRFLIDVVDERQRKGRRTKPLELALEDAHLAATVDAIMESDGKTLEQAVRRQRQWHRFEVVI